MNIYTELKRVFKLPSPLHLAVNELHRANIELLSAESHAEFNNALVTYNKQRILRLTMFINKVSREL